MSNSQAAYLFYLKHIECHSKIIFLYSDRDVLLYSSVSFFKFNSYVLL